MKMSYENMEVQKICGICGDKALGKSNDIFSSSSSSSSLNILLVPLRHHPPIT